MLLERRIPQSQPDKYRELEMVQWNVVRTLTIPDTEITQLTIYSQLGLVQTMANGMRYNYSLSASKKPMAFLLYYL